MYACVTAAFVADKKSPDRKDRNKATCLHLNDVVCCSLTTNWYVGDGPAITSILSGRKRSSTMADHLAAAVEEAQDDNEIFVYMGGDQQVPDGVRPARIHNPSK